jgi:hypothetical protein
MAKIVKPAASISFNEICSIRMELRDTDPLIWREVEVPTSITMKVLHDIIQIAMDWFDDHLWEFRIGDRRIMPPEDDEAEPSSDPLKVRLRDVLRPGTTTIDYLYDFVDCWEHRLTVTGIRQGAPGVLYPRYAGGEWAAPPEDCGGIGGFYAALDALADLAHPDHAEVAERLEEYDPKEIDVFVIGVALRRIAKRRNAVAKRLAGKQG